MIDLMLDLETMGNRAGCAVVAIGVVKMDLDALVLQDEFYTTVDLESCLATGLTVQADTIKWWLQQSDEARHEIITNTQVLAVALNRFSYWLDCVGRRDDRRVWGNGAGFDPPIMEAAFRAAGHRVPWEFWNVRCYRTLKNQYREVAVPESKTDVKHHALDDARHQARHLLEIFRYIKTGGAGREMAKFVGDTKQPFDASDEGFIG